MILHKTSRDSGFTLVEMLVVLGIVGFMFAMTPVFDMSTLSRVGAKEEADVFINLLMRARNASVNECCGEIDGYGICVGEEYFEFVLFVDGVEEVKELIKRSGGVDVSFGECVVFGDSGVLNIGENDVVEVVFSQSVSSTSVKINHEGGIIY